MPSLATNPTIGIITGGRSAERDRSLLSGRTVEESLLRQGYTTTLIDLSAPDAVDLIQHIDIAFLAIAGQYAEDGKLQGLLETLDIPYTGSGVMASALAMNKAAAKTVVAAAGVPVLDHVTVRPAEGLTAAVDTVTGALELPVIVKPVSEGGSVGMSLCRTDTELARALAQGSGTELLVEPFTAGMAVTVGVLERHGRPEALTPLETAPTRAEFYDYTAKRDPAGHLYRCPPPALHPDVLGGLRRCAVAAHRALGCAAYSRSDFIVAPDGGVFWLEVNTLPGLSAGGNLATAAVDGGISYDQLVRLILTQHTDPKEYRP